MKKILFITPYFGRSGSEMQLYYILKNIDSTKFKPILFSRDNGVLLHLLPNEIKHYTGYKQHGNFLYRILRLLLYAVNINPLEFQLRLLNKKIKPDYWYINTIANRDAINIAVKLKIPFITHFHELPMSYSLVKYNTIEAIIKESILLIGCSKIVCEKLVDMGHKNVQLLYGFIDDENIKITKSAAEIHQELKIMPTDFVWIISGHANTTKGIDFLIPLIKKLPKNHKIIWLGEKGKSGTSFYVDQSIKENFNGRIIFTGNKSHDYYSYFNAGNAYLSLSREDSFPLVLIEAAYLGKPIVGINSGGIKEFVKEEIGIVVNQINYDELQIAMEAVEKNYGNYNKELLKQYAQSFNPQTQTNKLMGILETV
jgi:L-malate glycosyltransferase